MQKLKSILANNLMRDVSKNNINMCIFVIDK